MRPEMTDVLDTEREEFEALLGWLDADRERAGRRYEEIRRALCKIFAGRACHEAEELADETIRRVARKSAGLAPTYEGDPALYFFGVAQKVHLEYLRRERRKRPPPPARGHTPEDERRLECLDECAARLPERSRELVYDYYVGEKSEKIEHRRALAARLGVTPAVLRLRAHRIRNTLETCVRACLRRRQ